MSARFVVADVFDGLATLDDGSVDLVVTSPPFGWLRSYLPADHPDKSKEIGQEEDPAAFIDVMLRVTAEMRRVLDWRPGLVLDPFAGSGTTLAVATGHGYDAIGIDLDSRNLDLARERVGFFLDEGAHQ